MFFNERFTYGFAVFLLVGALVLASWIIITDHAETRTRAEAALSNLDSALEKDIARNVELYDLAIQETAAALRLPGIADVTPAIRHAALFNRIATADFMGSIIVLDRTGSIMFDSVHIDGRSGNRADRSYFLAAKNSASNDLFISEPISSRFSQQEVIIFSRRLDGPDGRFEGVVAWSVQTAYFRQLFAQFDLGPNGALTLLRTDGTLIARYPTVPGVSGHSIAGSARLNAMLRTPSGIIDGASGIDGVGRVQAYRRVGNFPLIIVASYGHDAVFAAWREHTLIIGAALIALIGLATVLLIALRRQLTRRVAAEASARASADQARRSERNLATAFDQLDVLFQNSGDPHFSACRRPDGQFVFDLLNRHAEAVSGLLADGILGKTPCECLPTPVGEAIVHNWDRCVARGETIYYESTHQMPIGLRSWETVLVPVRDGDGQICRLVGTMRDITERKAAERALISHNSLLERRAAEARAAQDDALLRASGAERLQVLGQLASGIAHDFNNVLQSVSGCADLVERRAEDPQTIRRAARLIAEAAARGSSITNRLLTFSRTKHDPVVERVAVAGFLDDVADLLRHTLRGGGYIEIRTEIEADDLTVTTEPNQLQTVLLNLATNARDAMPHGGTLVLGASPVSSTHPTLVGDDYTRLWVRDDGEGMDEATLARVTEPFFTTKPVGKGTGLGLSMAKSYAEEVNGRLTIDSRPGAGTTVSLWLPR